MLSILLALEAAERVGDKWFDMQTQVPKGEDSWKNWGSKVKNKSVSRNFGRTFGDGYPPSFRDEWESFHYFFFGGVAEVW
ncbi:hypothetical protein BOW52_08095 [Solemya elarraichensis gill symbiont]|uniref:Uncharacterized protein n=1 Tax=Solemya elarraichensis gill symbiont TaxID=1918949 RepID=A0A1T2L0X6_9GAMM|nr:hypothetical protein BOW52_08095 [Solemya elarraichensis gill symbiont]